MYTILHDQKTQYNSKTEELSVEHFLRAKFYFKEETAKEDRKTTQKRIKELSSGKNSLEEYMLDKRFSAQFFKEGKLRAAITAHDIPIPDGSLFQKAIDWNNIMDLEAVQHYVLTGKNLNSKS